MRLKFFVLVVLLTASTVAINAQVNFGLAGGINFQNINGTDHNGDKLENGLLTAFHAGVKINIPIAPDFFFQTGLTFAQKGSRNNFVILTKKSSDDDLPATTRISYLDLPLHLLFRPQFSKGHILLGFGPYVALGLGGKQKYDADPIFYEQDIKFKNQITNTEFYDLQNSYYRRFDAGADVFAGYEFDFGLFFQINTQLGLLKINPELVDMENDEAAYKNTGFGLSVGYMF